MAPVQELLKYRNYLSETTALPVQKLPVQELPVQELTTCQELPVRQAGPASRYTQPARLQTPAFRMQHPDSEATRSPAPLAAARAHVPGGVGGMAAARDIFAPFSAFQWTPDDPKRSPVGANKAKAEQVAWPVTCVRACPTSPRASSPTPRRASGTPCTCRGTAWWLTAFTNGSPVAPTSSSASRRSRRAQVQVGRDRSGTLCSTRICIVEPEETEARPAADFTHCHLKFKLNQLDSGTQGVSLAPGIRPLPICWTSPTFALSGLL